MAIVKRVSVVACDFCGKTEHEVEGIVVSGGEVAICNECVGLCVEIFTEKGYAMPAKTTPAVETAKA